MRRDLLTGALGADEIRRGCGQLQEIFGSRLAGVIVQPVVAGGVEITISVLHEQVVGPLVLFRLGRAGGELADRAARFALLADADADADDLIRSVGAAPGLVGLCGRPAADVAGLWDMLLRVCRMAGDLPQVAGFGVGPGSSLVLGVGAVDGRVRVRAAGPAGVLLVRLG
jgi:ATP-grasp domain